MSDHQQHQNKMNSLPATAAVNQMRRCQSDLTMKEDVPSTIPNRGSLDSAITTNGALVACSFTTADMFASLDTNNVTKTDLKFPEIKWHAFQAEEDVRTYRQNQGPQLSQLSGKESQQVDHSKPMYSGTADMVVG